MGSPVSISPIDLHSRVGIAGAPRVVVPVIALKWRKMT